MSKWAGVRYLRVALQQKDRGLERVDLGTVENADSPEVMPDKLSEWLATSRHGEDGESVS